MLKKSVIAGTIIFSNLLFASNSNVLSSNFSYISFNKANENKMYSIGVDYIIKKDNIKFEINTNLKRLTYNKKDSNSTNLYNDNPYDQADISLAFSFGNEYFTGKIGNHIILHYQKNDVVDHHDNIYFANLEIKNDNVHLVRNDDDLFYDDEYDNSYYDDEDTNNQNNLSIGLGSNIYYSDYDNFNVKQISPYIYLKNFIPHIELKAQFNNIKISETLSNLSTDSYKNYDYLIAYSFEDFSLGANFSIGKNAYKVFNNGNDVHNLGLEYKNSYSLLSNFKFSEQTNFKLNFIHSIFVENNKNCSSNKIEMNLIFKY